MKDDRFIIHIEQLRHGRTKAVDELLDPSFLDIHETGLFCNSPVRIVGEAYLADHELLLHFETVETEAFIPCSICNELVKVPVVLKGVYQSLPLSEIHGGAYNFKEFLREELILAIPHFTECKGSCPRRSEIAKYLAPDIPNDPNAQGVGHK